MVRKGGVVLISLLVLLIMFLLSLIVYLAINFVGQGAEPTPKPVVPVTTGEPTTANSRIQQTLATAPDSFLEKYGDELIFIDQLTLQHSEQDCLQLTLKNQCLIKLAYVKNDPTLCPRITYEPYRQQCEREVGQ